MTPSIEKLIGITPHEAAKFRAERDARRDFEDKTPLASLKAQGVCGGSAWDTWYKDEYYVLSGERL
jgi:hypothetical protein